MVAIIITTYYPENLRISLTRLKWLKFPFHLVIHNDNPEINLTKEDIRNYGYEGGSVILNEKTNLGCFDSRLVSIEYVINNLLDCSHFIFCDDDDILLNPEFSDHYVTNHNALVVHRLRDQLSLLVPEPDIEKVKLSQFVEDERPKMGCVGVSYKTKLWRELVPIIKGFKPILAKLYGSNRIMEPDDVYYMNIVRMYFNWKYPDRPIDSFYYDSPNYSYSLTYLEDRLGRYNCEKGVKDLRYGVWDGHTTYKQLVDEMCYAFMNYLKTL